MVVLHFNILWILIMMPIAYLRSQTAFEIEETLKFSGLSDKRVFDRIREKVVSPKNTYYKLKFNHGEIQVYGPRFILINGEKYKSVYDAQRKLVSYIR